MSAWTIRTNGVAGRRRGATWRQRWAARAGVAALVGVSASCGAVVRQGRSPVFLQIELLSGQRGGLAGPFTSPLASDVLTNVTTPLPCTTSSPCPTVFADAGQVTLRTVLKNATSVTGPTPVNDVTITRYRVTYARADGRKTEGIDVPFAFDGATTGTIRVGVSTSLPFELVRAAAKKESPLVNLVNSAAIVNTIAEVTFFGTDQAGNAVRATGLIQIEFANFGDISLR